MRSLVLFVLFAGLALGRASAQITSVRHPMGLTNFLSLNEDVQAAYIIGVAEGIQLGDFVPLQAPQVLRNCMNDGALKQAGPRQLIGLVKDDVAGLSSPLFSALASGGAKLAVWGALFQACK